MARGGIYDQLAGGFARYAVDEAWVVPHFEKMLYDNALLLRCYAQLARRDSQGLAGRVCEQTVAFLDEALGTPGGGFASSLDADAGGVEGATYVWTPAPVSYTHLRAHETVLDLVCRLLLEKKNNRTIQTT